MEDVRNLFDYIDLGDIILVQFCGRHLGYTESVEEALGYINDCCSCPPRLGKLLDVDIKEFEDFGIYSYSLEEIRDVDDDFIIFCPICDCTVAPMHYFGHISKLSHEISEEELYRKQRLISEDIRFEEIIELLNYWAIIRRNLNNHFKIFNNYDKNDHQRLIR